MAIANVVGKPLLNPLTEEDYAALQHVINQAAVHADLITRCANCGMNMEEHSSRNTMHKEVAQRMMDQFFPQPTVGGET